MQSTKASIFAVCWCISTHNIMGNLQFPDIAIAAKQILLVLEQHMLPSGQHLFQERPAYFSKNVKLHSEALQKSNFKVDKRG